LAPLAVFDPAIDHGPLAEAPFGANMAFRRAMFEKYGAFREDLGRSGDNLISNEETEFCSRLFSGGEQLLYVPSAVVYHPVAANRIKKEYFLSWWQGKARSDVRAFGLPAGTKWFIAGIPLNLFRRLTVWTIRWLLGIDPARRFRSKTKVWSIVGMISECYRLSRRSLRSSPTTPSS
jgi:GT2 family glycosyltransferase